MAWGWTRAERRGAVVVLALYLIGTGWDLYRAAHPRPAARVAREAQPPAAAAPALAQPATRAAPDTPLDLNRANPGELDGLPGIGPVLARRIIAHRNEYGPFLRIEDLRAVRGVGPRLYERLAPRVRVISPDTRPMVKPRAARTRAGNAIAETLRTSAPPRH